MTLINFLTFTILALALAKNYGVSGGNNRLAGVKYNRNIIALHIARARFKIEFAANSVTKIYIISAISTVPSLPLLRFTSLPDLFEVIAGGVLYPFIDATLTPLTRIASTPELQTVTRITQKIQPLTLIAEPTLKYQQKILRVTAKAADTS